MRVRRATGADIDRILRVGLREADRAEARKLGLNPSYILRESFTLSDFCAALDYKGRVFAVGGVARKTLMSDTGLIWLLCTDEVEECSLGFLRASKSILSRVDKEYDRLENIVDVENVSTIKWLSWLGFTFEDDPVITPLGFKFLRFRR